MREDQLKRILELVDEIWQGNRDKNVMKSIVTQLLYMVEYVHYDLIEFDLVTLKKSLNDNNLNEEGENDEAKSSN